MVLPKVTTLPESVRRLERLDKGKNSTSKSDTFSFKSLFEKISGHNDKDQIEQSVNLASEKYNVPKELICAVIKQESNFNPKACSPVGAEGLMQLMPGTAKDLGVRNSFNIRENVMGGTKYLRQLLDKFKGDLPKAVAAYNAGPGAVERAGGIPNYAETKNYVPSVLKHYEDNLKVSSTNKNPAGAIAQAGFEQETITNLLKVKTDSEKSVSEAIKEELPSYSQRV
ncbi:MAG: lytic transglycosylase domain-containing protein [bacterium]|nr:lytic transglycosylase domain-containing protein [bacterium]